MRLSALSAVTVLSAVLAAVPAAAQMDRAHLSGVVSDPSGGRVADAEIIATLAATGLTRSTTSDGQGVYHLASLPPGRYVVTAAKAGFESLAITDVELTVGQRRTLDVAMRVGAVSSEIQVVAPLAALDRTSAEIGGAITRRQIEAAPLNGRNWATLMTFAPGATNSGEGNQGNIRFFGRARDDNNWTFDGVDATGVKDPRQEASLRLVMSAEAIAEFRVSSSGYSADGGTGAGAQVNLVSRSGTNRWSGGGFEYFRDEALDERRILDTLPEEPAFRLNQYGFSFGGPLVRDRTFVFATFEGLRQRLDVANQTAALVPSAAYRARAAAVPALAPVIAAYPVGSRPTANPDVDEYFGRRRLTWSEDSFLARIDHRFDDRTPAFIRVNGVNGVIDSEVRSDLLETRRSEAFPTNLTGQVQRVLSGAALAEVKFGWNRSPLERLDQGLGAEGYEIRNTFTPTRATLFIEENPQAFSYLGNVVLTRGRHTMKVGGEFRRIHVDVANGAATSVRWNSSADFLANRTNRIRIDGELPLQQVRRWYGIGFAQTEWRAAETLTVSAGLRYEYYSVATEASGNGNVLDLDACPPTAASIYCPAGTDWYDADPNNFAPRLGVAWTPSPGWVVRGGYGMYFSPGQNDDVTAAIDSLAQRGELTSAASYPVAPFVPQILSLANSRPRALQRDRRDMFAHVYSASLQREIAGAYTAQAAYVGSRGRNAFNRIFVNTIDPATGRRPAAPFLTTQIDRKSAMGETEYDGLLLSLQRSFRDGLLIQANYTLGRSRDNNAGNGEGSEWQDARCGDCEWGPSDFDTRHVFAFNGVYQLPFGAGRARLTSGVGAAVLGGWDVAAVVYARSGRPINVLVNRTGPDGNDVNQRPNLTGAAEPLTGDITRWFNPSAFAVPSATEFGNAPRNGFRGPSAWQLDVSLSRRIGLGGRAGLELRVDGFNVANADQYGNPARDFTQPLTFGTPTPLNAQPTGTGTARQFQLGVRLTF
jgi:outer membrane receptor protein involved in Fe transport